jgi:hypothetical protein
MRKIFTAGAMCVALAGCIQADRPEPVAPEPVAGAVTWSDVPNSGGVSVGVYEDPGGCQYLIFLRPSHSTAMSVVTRQSSSTNGVCKPSRK